ncbi:MAG: hypothetical protein ACE5LS_08010 [Thermoplasmata archaeon]
MSRGGWVLLIGGVLLLVGIGLFAFGSASFLSAFAPDFATLAPGEFQNRTVNVEAPGSVLTYMVGIQDFTAGDQVTVFILTPSGGEERRATVNSTGPLTDTYLTAEAGLHTLVIQNTAPQSVDIFFAANEIDLTAAGLVFAGTLLGVAGFIVLIVGLVLWLVDRGKRRRPTTGMPPPPS